MRDVRCFLLAAAVFVGCSGEDDDDGSAAATSANGSTSELGRSIAEDLDAIDEDGAVTFTSSEAACTAERVVSEIGISRLTELGAGQGGELTALAWSPDERAIVFAAVRSCVDLQAQLTDLFAADTSLTAEQAACIAESYADSDALPEAIFSTETDSDVNAQVDNAISSAYESCA